MMEMKIEKAKEIESYIEGDPKCKQHNNLAVDLKGQREALDVFRLPFDMLIYNKRNGRFAAEIKEKQDEIERDLDPYTEDDRKIINDLLLKEDDEATHDLKENLKKFGQLEPGIITFDGVVINGNRRMAVFEELLGETSDRKYAFLTVARLPTNVDEQDLYRLEVGLQLSRPYRQDYGPINDLLKIKEGKRIGLKPKAIANSMFAIKESEIKKKIEVLKLIEDYLVYIGKPEQHAKVRRFVEHFIDLQNAIATFQRERMNPKEIQAATIAGFELIIAGVPHMEIRAIRKAMREKITKRKIIESVKRVTKEKFGSSKNAGIIDATKASKKKKKPERSQAKIAEEFKEDFEHIRETLQAVDEKNKPKKLLDRALTYLEGVDPKNKELKNQDITEILKKIDSIVRKLLKGR